MPGEARHREQPAAMFQPVAPADFGGIDAGMKDPGVRTQRDGTNPIFSSNPELLQHSPTQRCGPGAIRHEDRSRLKQATRRPALDHRALGLPAQDEQIATVEKYSVGDPRAHPRPTGGIRRRLEIPAPDEVRRQSTSESLDSPGPAPSSLQGPQASRGNGQSVDRALQQPVGLLAAGILAGRDDKRARRTAPGQLAHPPGDPSSHWREVMNEKELPGHGLRPARSRRHTIAASGAARISGIAPERPVRGSVAENDLT